VRGWNRPEGVRDESLESFLIRRGHPDTARALGSALGHGIYAADARLLSVRAAFPKLWELEEKGNGRVLWALLSRSRRQKEEERRKLEGELTRYELGDVMKLMDGAAVYSFRDGMGTYGHALGCTDSRHQEEPKRSNSPRHRNHGAAFRRRGRFRSAHIVFCIYPCQMLGGV